MTVFDIVQIVLLLLAAQTPRVTSDLKSQKRVPQVEHQLEDELMHIQRRDQAVIVGGAAFEQACITTLLNPPVTSDGFISQFDFANFIRSYCISQQACPAGFQLEFFNLPIRVQLAFAFSCEIPHCDIATNGNEFGFNYTMNRRILVDPAVRQLCGSLYPLVGDFVAPTLSPSMQPGSTLPPVSVAPQAPTIGTQSPVTQPPAGTTMSPVAPSGQTQIPVSPTAATQSPVVSTPGTPSPVAPTLGSQAPVAPSAATQSPAGTSPATTAPFAPATGTRAPLATTQAPVLSGSQSPVAPSAVTQSPAGTSPVTTAPFVPTTGTQAPILSPSGSQAPVAPSAATQSPAGASPVTVAPIVPTTGSQAPIISPSGSQAPVAPSVATQSPAGASPVTMAPVAPVTPTPGTPAPIVPSSGTQLPVAPSAATQSPGAATSAPAAGNQGTIAPVATTPSPVASSLTPAPALPTSGTQTPLPPSGTQAPATSPTTVQAPAVPTPVPTMPVLSATGPTPDSTAIGRGGVIALILAGAGGVVMLFCLFGSHWFVVCCVRDNEEDTSNQTGAFPSAVDELHPLTSDAGGDSMLETGDATQLDAAQSSGDAAEDSVATGAAEGEGDGRGNGKSLVSGSFDGAQTSSNVGVPSSPVLNIGNPAVSPTTDLKTPLTGTDSGDDCKDSPSSISTSSELHELDSEGPTPTKEPPTDMASSVKDLFFTLKVNRATPDKIGDESTAVCSEESPGSSRFLADSSNHLQIGLNESPAGLPENKGTLKTMRKSGAGWRGLFWGRKKTVDSAQQNGPEDRSVSPVPTTPPRAETPVATSPDLSLRAQLDAAVSRFDWGLVEALASQIEEEATGVRQTIITPPRLNGDEKSVASLRTLLDAAVARQDWDEVEALTAEILASSVAKKVRKDWAESALSTPNSRYRAASYAPTAAKSYATLQSNQSKKGAISLLVNEGRWNIVSSLSSVYGLDNSLLTSDVGTLEGEWCELHDDNGSIESAITDECSMDDFLTPEKLRKRALQPPFFYERITI